MVVISLRRVRYITGESQKFSGINTFPKYENFKVGGTD